MNASSAPTAFLLRAGGAAEWLHRVLLALVVAISSAMVPAAASAHEVRPAYLSMQEEAPNEFSVLFKIPMQGNAVLALSALFSGNIETLTPVISHPTGDAMVRTWRMRTTKPLAGHTVLIDGLQNTMTDALVRVAFANGNSWTARLTPSEPSAVIPAKQSVWAVFATYVRHGIEHIAFGFDHLLFVAGLMLIVRDWRKLIKAITAFTAAHSITLASATLGWIALPPKPVEVLIAISIVIVATEVVHMERGKLSFTIKSPWVVAFAFGMLHGFGFAGALVEIGLPRGDIPLALLGFNAGVELGQLAFVGVILAGVYLIRQFIAIPRQTVIACAYVIGIVAAFWSVQRLDAMFS